MIRIDLVDRTNNIKHIEVQVVPVAEEHEYPCVPEGILPFRSVKRLSRQLKAGRVAGEIGKFVWYRLIETPQHTPTTTFGIQI
jgi:hypothetical protein